MENKLIIERLQLTIDNLKKLKPEQFNYAEIVTKFDETKGCGTVCCVMGFYPVWYKESFKYRKIKSGVSTFMYTVDNKEVESYHGITSFEFFSLFYGYGLAVPKLDSIVTMSEYVSLYEVIDRFEILKVYYENKYND